MYIIFKCIIMYLEILSGPFARNCNHEQSSYSHDLDMRLKVKSYLGKGMFIFQSASEIINATVEIYLNR